MISNTNTLSIETLLMQAFDKVTDSATEDLRTAVDRIDGNLKMKNQLRDMEKTMELLKNAQRSGNTTAATDYLNQLKTKATAAGYSSSSELMQLLNNPAAFTDKTKFDDWTKSVDTVVQAESQNYSDVGQKLQFQLNEANNIYNRATKTASDLAATHDRTANAVVANIKG